MLFRDQSPTADVCTWKIFQLTYLRHDCRGVALELTDMGGIMLHDTQWASKVASKSKLANWPDIKQKPKIDFFLKFRAQEVSKMAARLGSV